MISREFWKNRILSSWEKAPIVWLTGVRRSGKTTLCREFSQARYINCDLTETAAQLENPEFFYRSVSAPIVVFDEVHQLSDPSRILKIGADLFPQLKILATGSSSLAATQKFGDSLTGRKRTVELLPVLDGEWKEFDVSDLRVRLLRGGLPPMLLANQEDPGFYAEWLDSYFARDVQELFRIERRSGFLRLLELLLRQSGGLFEATALAQESGLSRPTVLNYLETFQMTHTVYVLRPFHRGGRQEVLKQPKIYGFDTGFVCHARRWKDVRDEDSGVLWEHLVLDQMRADHPDEKIHFWRDKQKHEVDFVLPRLRDEVDAIECKWSPKQFDAVNLKAFRALHPQGKNYLITPQVEQPYVTRIGNLDIHVQRSVP